MGAVGCRSLHVVVTVLSARMETLGISGGSRRVDCIDGARDQA